MSKQAKSSKKTPDGKMTIGELARRTGMTIRNIRAHQTRGLLPPPEVQAAPATTTSPTSPGSN